MFFEYKEIKLEISNRNVIRKYLDIQKLNSIFVNN